MKNSFTVLGRPCHLEKQTYRNNGRLALILYFDDYKDYGDYVVFTVNLIDEPCSEGHAYIDTNNCPWAEEFLISNGLGKPVGIGFSGFCIYPCYKIDLSKVVRC